MKQLTVRLLQKRLLHELKAALLQQFFCFDSAKNFHPLLAFQRQNLSEMFKIFKRFMRSKNVTIVMLHLLLIFRPMQMNTC